MLKQKESIKLLFLDVEHIFTEENEKKNFYSKNFTKITAMNYNILNGKLFHPLKTFKALISGKKV